MYEGTAASQSTSHSTPPTPPAPPRQTVDGLLHSMWRFMVAVSSDG